MSEHQAVAAAAHPTTVESLAADLRRIGVKSGDVLVVHASLSSLGWICGGAVAVIEALLRVLTSEGTLVMPAHSTGLSEPSNWQNPPVPESWWSHIREHMPAFHPGRTPTRKMGAIAELFRTWPGVVRSDHPTSSMAALGRHAQQIVQDHALDDPMGERSPLGRIYELDGRVLLLGVGHDKNSSLHLSERRAFGVRHVRVKTGSPVMVDGRRRWVEYQEPLACADDFAALGEDFEATGNVVTQDRARLMSQRVLVDFGVQWLVSRRERDGRLFDEGALTGQDRRYTDACYPEFPNKSS